VEQWSGGQVGESSMRKSCMLSGGFSGMHLSPPLARHDKLNVEGRHERPQDGFVRTGGSADPRAALFASVSRPGDCQVGPKVGMGVFAVFLTRYLVFVEPWIHVLSPDWSRVCFFGSMRCHGHVDACVAAHHHVAWCGSHWAHMMSSSYLSHPGSDVCK
jgi:hypothetical protein